MRFFNVMGLFYPKFKNEVILRSLPIAALMLLTSCSEKMFDPPPVAAEPVVEAPKVSVLSRNLIETKYQPTATPNRYNAKIKWPAYEGTIKFYDEKKVSLTEEPIKSEEYVIQGLEGGTERTFILETLSKDKNSRTQIELLLLPPKDIILGQNISATQDLSILAGRIFIADNVTILTNDRCLSFEFNELIIGNNVSVYNFDPSTKAPQEKNGRDGGCLKLKGKSATGYIKFFSNSEQGGDGFLGFPRCEGTHATEIYWDCYGTNGGNSGKRGSFLLELENATNFDFDFKILDVLGGLRGEKNPNLNAHERTKICSAHIENYKTNPNYIRERHFKCDVAPTAGLNATGGKMCFKLKLGMDYECIEKN